MLTVNPWKLGCDISWCLHSCHIFLQLEESKKSIKSNKEGKEQLENAKYQVKEFKIIQEGLYKYMSDKENVFEKQLNFPHINIIRLEEDDLVMEKF